MKPRRIKTVKYAVPLLGLVALTGLLKLLGGHVNATTIALAFLLLILFVAVRFGARLGVLSSLLGMLVFNFFFLPPVGQLSIRDSDNWVTLAVFLLTAITVGQLSARARRRAEEAEAGKREIESLYQKLQGAFERASQAEALKRSERLKSALLDAVTHDIRTPLTSIKACVTTLLDELQSERLGTATLRDEDRREMLEVIDEETDRLNAFVGSLLELARIEAGEMQLRPRTAAVNDIVMAALDRAKPLTERHAIELLLEDGLPTVQVDGRAVAQVLYTLLDNAAKYSPVGTYIQIIAYREEGDTVRIIVEDQGRGIPPDLRERVFDKFFRAMQDGEAGKPHSSGTGLGLAIARGIIEAHKGRIWVEGGRDGVGTRVMIILPIGKEVIAAPAGVRPVVARENDPA